MSSAASTRSLAERVWWAYCAMPLGKNGKLPSRRSIEMEHHLPLAVLSKLFVGERHSVDQPTLLKLATAFGVSAEWLLTGRGDGPPPPDAPMQAESEDRAADEAPRGRRALTPDQAERLRDAIVKLRRDQYGDNNSALARALGLSQSAVSQLVRGKNTPGFSTAARVAEMLGAGVLEVLDGGEQSATDAPASPVALDFADFALHKLQPPPSGVDPVRWSERHTATLQALASLRALIPAP